MTVIEHRKPVGNQDYDDITYSPGWLFHRSDGLSGCGNPECGWFGVPTFLWGQRQDECPACESIATDEFLVELRAEISEIRRERVGRNAPCPCGSGRKYKKCCLRR